jgi:hypothetical protein
VTSFRVTSKKAFGLHLAFLQLETTGNTVLSLIYTLLQFTVTHALVFIVFTSRIPVTDFIPVLLSFQITHGVFFRSPITFLSLFCNCQFGRIDPIQFLCSQATKRQPAYESRLRPRNSTRLDYYCQLLNSYS